MSGARLWVWASGLVLMPAIACVEVPAVAPEIDAAPAEPPGSDGGGGAAPQEPSAVDSGMDSNIPDAFKGDTRTDLDVERPPECAPAVDDPLRPGGPVSTTDLVGRWALDGDWRDVHGENHLTPHTPGGFSAVGPGEAQVYGPTCNCPGAVAPSLDRVDLTRGATLEGWYWYTSNEAGCQFARDDNVKNVLFGFGAEDTWDQDRFQVLMAQNVLEIRIGNAAAGLARIEDGGWHHVAVVLPAGYRGDVPVEIYRDGVVERPCVTDHVPEPCARCGEGGTCPPLTVSADEVRARLFVAGADEARSPFGIGQFSKMPDAFAVHDVRLWARALTPADVAVLGHCSQAPAVEPELPAWDACAWYRPDAGAREYCVPDAPICP